VVEVEVEVEVDIGVEGRLGVELEAVEVAALVHRIQFGIGSNPILTENLSRALAPRFPPALELVALIESPRSSSRAAWYECGFCVIRPFWSDDMMAVTSPLESCAMARESKCTVISAHAAALERFRFEALASSFSR